MKKLPIIFLLLFHCTFASFGQPGSPYCLDPNTDPDDVNCHDDEPIPLDSGTSLLLIAGVLYGLKKINDKNRPVKTQIG